MRTDYCGLIDKNSGQTVTVKGWAHRRRDHGGVIFIDLRDREGLVQVVIDPDTRKPSRPPTLAQRILLKITGIVRERPAGTANANPDFWRNRSSLPNKSSRCSTPPPPAVPDRRRNLSENVRRPTGSSTCAAADAKPDACATA